MKKGDKIAAILIVTLIIISVISVFLYKQHIKGSHRIATIKQNGKIIKTIDLNAIKENQEIKITYDGNHYNIVEIVSDKIRIKDADCPDKICVKNGWISEPGQSSVCLPHKLIISIQGKNSKFDQITS
ncbi:NusG domain II-containing protein [Clostridium sp. P21]|uniref:NusG domain II-containing protein n=1 Tax=Clostridium muellerianum TaxID=2716538 RepID=A0A7Y0EDC8_9CLOT|nr:NusG domain II-containing protein [Clostridium muellerianum]NMM61333.1 NusG domain II-containing protein [Clostridium muellerianum]